MNEIILIFETESSSAELYIQCVSQGFNHYDISRDNENNRILFL